MESFNKNANTLLISAGASIGLVGYGLYIFLLSFEEIFLNFETQFPLWLAWVLPTFRFWPFLAIVYLVLFAISFTTTFKESLSFNKLSVRLSVVGFALSLLLVVFAVLTVYWPLVENA
ncbi:hypothetical protein ACFO4O_15700 [Glaciecola siphonariae]|uniref:Uncharacterized protein n=1 Tax=Glaciecola siphonariae TaxID=521012 RepID=A0ABV9LZG6_9ALTE